VKAVAMIALTLAFAGSAHADTRPWFVGASVHYIRDGRAEADSFDIWEYLTGWGTELEAGRTLLPWLSVSLTYRVARVSGEVYIDPGDADFTEWEHRLGPRIDIWPIAGRFRMGATFVRSWRRGEVAFNRGPARVGHVRTVDNMYELSLGVVPVRWQGYELEVSGTFSREPSTRYEQLSTFSVGLGLRWRTGP